MEIIKKYRVLIAMVLVLGLVGAGIFYFFARMYQNDMQALTEFVASYETYDQAVTALKGTPTSVEWDQKTSLALAGLNAKASFRLSSLIKNEKKAMSTAQEIADLSGKELIALKAYQKAAGAQGSDLDRLAKELAVLSNQRQTAFAGFMELGK